MYTARNYVKAASLEEAWELNQKRSNAILGGGCWMRLAKRRYDTLIDLNGLGLEGIREENGTFFLGAMTTLREIEESSALCAAFGGYFKDCTRHIVGVQFRNCATLGGSVRARFGFSDVVTALLPLPGAAVELYKGGTVALGEYVNMAYDRDLLLGVRIGGAPCEAAYESMRNSETDLPVLTCAVCRDGQSYRAAIGARPGRAALLTGETEEALLARAAQLHYASNLRAGAAYREHLSGVLLRRALRRIWEAEA